jgi:hypothetical protein
VLNDDKPGGTATFKEIVTEQSRFFHPYGVKGWPTEPPNFWAYRWDGAVRRIHRVVSYEVVSDLSEVWPEMTPWPWKSTHWRPPPSASKRGASTPTPEERRGRPSRVLPRE